MTRLVAGVDEIATERQLAEGWTYCVLPEADYAALEQRLAAARSGKRRPFHGRSFRKAEQSTYAHFLRAVRESVEASGGPACLHFTLNNPSWKAQFTDFVERIAAGSLAAAGVADAAALRQLQALFPGLVTLQRLLREVGGEHELRLEIDRDDVTERFAAATTDVSGRAVALERLLSAMYRAHRAHRFAESPALVEPGGIAVVSDARSIIVQAADVVGNFAMAYAMFHLGDPSRTREVKAEVFDAVFGDVITPDAVLGVAELRGGELALKIDGALTLSIGTA